MRTVAIFTGNRAEYGLQLPIIRAIDAHPDLDYRLIVTGGHLDPAFGATISEIVDDGFRIDAKIEIGLASDAIDSTPDAIGQGIVAISRTLREMRPDFALVYADRFEGFAAVVAASQMNIPTGHIEGGDLTEGGALDDSVRHAMTKLSHLHFTTNPQASARILAMGEEDWRVHTTGFPVIDLIENGEYTPAGEVVKRYDIDPDAPLIVFTQHSVATEFDEAGDQIRESIAALHALQAQGIQVIVTYPNNDAGGRKIIEEIRAAFGAHTTGIRLHASLGRRDYHGLLALALEPSRRVVCVGNSSSGIKETPAFFCPAVNIGSRQKGRLRAENVLDADYGRDSVVAATKRALFDAPFRQSCREVVNPYGDGRSGPRIARVLSEVEPGKRLIQKRMTLAGEIKDGWYR